jgi:hypothetical protein
VAWQHSCPRTPHPRAPVFAADLLSAMDFDETGNYLATGDRGGRVVVFQRSNGDSVRLAPACPCLLPIADLNRRPPATPSRCLSRSCACPYSEPTQIPPPTSTATAIPPYPGNTLARWSGRQITLQAPLEDASQRSVSLPHRVSGGPRLFRFLRRSATRHADTTPTVSIFVAHGTLRLMSLLSSALDWRYAEPRA